MSKDAGIVRSKSASGQLGGSDRWKSDEVNRPLQLQSRSLPPNWHWQAHRLASPAALVNASRRLTNAATQPRLVWRRFYFACSTFFGVRRLSCRTCESTNCCVVFYCHPQKPVIKDCASALLNHAITHCDHGPLEIRSGKSTPRGFLLPAHHGDNEFYVHV